MAAQAAAAAARTDLDVRLLVDVSGSMAKTDPNGLLAPAVQLFLELLPDGAKAGVWAFAAKVDQRVQHDLVSPLWRAQALIRTSKLPTVGLRTALGDAIEAATWDRAESGQDRHLVVLSDGRLDLADEAAVNQAARGRLLREQLPALVAAGFSVHSVALSELGDLGFLRQLAQRGEGQYRQVADLAELPDALISLFAQFGAADRPLLSVVPTASQAQGPQQVPAPIGVGFRIEPDSAELTVVARVSESAVLELAAPNGRRFDRYQIPEGSRWHVGVGYEAVTLPRPEPGRWGIKGASSAQVFTYGELRLRLLDQPAQVAPGAIQTFPFTLEDRRSGAPVDSAFLDLVEFEVHIESEQGNPSVMVEPDTEAGMQVVVADLQGVERATLKLVATGPTFSRVLEHLFEVAHPLRVELRPAAQAEGTQLWVALNQPGLDYASVKMAAGVRAPPGALRWFPMQRAPAGMWSLELPENLAGKVELEVDVRANYLNMGEFSYRTRPLGSTLPLTDTERFSFDEAGRADQPARLLSAQQQVSEAVSDLRLEQPQAAAAPVQDASDTGEPEATEVAVAPVTVPIWFGGIAMLVPVLLVVGLGWLLGGLPVHTASSELGAGA